MPATSQEVIAGRDVLFYTEPFLAANTFPVDSAYGTSPGGSWVDSGYTKDGLHLGWRMQYIEYTVDQLLDPVARVPQSRDLRLRGNIGQVDAPDLVVASGQGTSSSLAAISGTRGHNDFTLTNTLATAYYSSYFDVKGPISGESCRVVGWKGRSVGDLNLDFHLADIAQVNIEHALIPDDSVSPARICQIRVITQALP